MTYSESAKGQRITADRAERECANHGCDVDEMWTDLQLNSDGRIDAHRVLVWLGY